MGDGARIYWIGSISAVLAGLLTASGHAVAQGYPIDWVTIGDTGNPAYQDPWGGLVHNRGSVAYEYRVGRYEITTGQWMEFVNTFSTQSDDMGLFGEPSVWGATIDWSYDGPGFRWKLNGNLENAEMVPVHGVSWRMAAQYCNWLHNDRSSDLSAIEDGAYDASTFSTNSDGTFNDQLTRHPDARYWIPSLDEWVKAAHYDPDRFGEGQGGWWDYPDGSDDPLYPGFPGEGETSATLDWDGAYLPLGAYADIQSPWGLFDLSGGTMEWTEEVHHSGKFRLTDGAPVFGFESFLVLDAVNEIAATDGPGSQSRLLGFRVAGAIPTPSSIALLVCAAGLCLQLARRRS